MGGRSGRLSNSGALNMLAESKVITRYLPEYDAHIRFSARHSTVCSGYAGPETDWRAGGPVFIIPYYIAGSDYQVFVLYLQVGVNGAAVKWLYFYIER